MNKGTTCLLHSNSQHMHTHTHMHASTHTRTHTHSRKIIRKVALVHFLPLNQSAFPLIILVGMDTFCCWEFLYTGHHHHCYHQPIFMSMAGRTIGKRCMMLFYLPWQLKVPMKYTSNAMRWCLNLEGSIVEFYCPWSMPLDSFVHAGQLVPHMHLLS